MDRKNPYNKIDKKINNQITKLIDNGFQQAALGTLDINNCPFVSKAIPMVLEGRIYLLMSDLSEHARNVANNPNVSLYFAAAEEHKTKSKNPRLSMQGKLYKLILQKDNVFFNKLLLKYSSIDFGSKLWANFDDFNFYKFEQKRKLYVLGFGRAYQELSE